MVLTSVRDVLHARGRVSGRQLTLAPSVRGTRKAGRWEPHQAFLYRADLHVRHVRIVIFIRKVKRMSKKYPLMSVPSGGLEKRFGEGCPLLASLQPLTDPLLFASSPAFHGAHGE